MDREIVKEESMYDFYREQTLLLTQEYKELKEKINKAIEYIEQLPFNDLVPIEVKVVYKILKGEDKE